MTIRTVGLIVNFYKKESVVIGNNLVKWLLDHDLQVVSVLEDAQALDLPALGVDEFCQAADMVWVVGGDGTLLRAARNVYGYDLPILGINQGYLGFLTEIELKDMDLYLMQLLEGHYAIEKRMMLSAKVLRGGVPIAEVNGLNDLVITKGALARIISLEIFLENGLVDHYLGDGVIFSTPTGSTGYSLSAGGPIVYPNFDLCLLTPICSHSLSARSIIFPPDKMLKVTLGTDNFQAMLTVDGQNGVELENRDTIMIQKAAHYTYLVKLRNRNFFQVMRDKLKGSSGDKYNQ